MTPSLRTPKWRWPLARLGLFTLAEAGLLVVTGAALRRFLQDAAAGEWIGLSGGALAAAALGSFAAGWFRSVVAEDLGMAYANDLRAMLAAHAALPGKRRRLGALAVRLTGDINPMRDWASLGLSDTAAGAAMVVSAIIVLTQAAGTPGLIAGAAVIAGAFLWFIALRGSLLQALTALRVSRGRVAAAAGDIVLGAGAIARFDAIGREQRRLDRRATQLRADAVRRRRWAAALEAPAALAAPAIVVLMLIVPGKGLDAGGWALVLFAAGLVGLGLRALARAVDSHGAFVVARRRMQAAAARIEEAAPAGALRAPRPRPDTPLFSFALPQVGEIKLGSGDVVLVHAAQSARAIEALQRVAAQNGGGLLNGVRIEALLAKEVARKVGIATPGIPLLRASLRRNLSLRRATASTKEMHAALRAVGLSRSRWKLETRIDPALSFPDEHTQALMRIARAIAHKPDVLIVAEPILQFSPDTPAMVARIAEFTGAAVVCASSATAPPGVGRIVLTDPLAV